MVEMELEINERKRLANVQMEQNEWALKFCTHLAACACRYQQHHQQALKLHILHCTRIIICYNVIENKAAFTMTMDE